MKFFCPQGIGDALWALHKIRAIAAAHGAESIDLRLSSSDDSPLQRRAIPFLERFPFLDSVGLQRGDCAGQPRTIDGCWNYFPDGFRGDVGYCLMPNAVLERGQRLESWLPEHPIDWGTMGEFRFADAEESHARQLADNLGPFAVFYIGPMAGNTTDGHNRGPLWTPRQWVELGRLLQSLGLHIIVVGAAYDRAYWREHVKAAGGGNWPAYWNWHIGQTLAVVKRAALCVSYQSGIGISAHYLGVPTAMWWRPKGNSCSPTMNITFSEDMAHCWTNPEHRAKYLPLIYGRCSPATIADFYRGLT